MKSCVSVVDAEGEGIQEEGMAVVLGLLFPFEIINKEECGDDRGLHGLLSEPEVTYSRMKWVSGAISLVTRKL